MSLTPEQREGVLELFGTVFGTAKADYLRERFDWQYGDNPARVPGHPTNWIVLRNGQVAGHLGAIVFQLKVGREYHPAFWGVDLMTHPDHRADDTILELFDSFEKSEALPVGFSMANLVSRMCLPRRYRLLAIGSTMIRFTSLVGALSLTCRLPLKRGRLSRIAARVRWRLRTIRLWMNRPPRIDPGSLAGWTGEVLAEPPTETNALWEAVADGYPVAARRSEVDLRWRYCSDRAPARFLTLRRDGELALVAVLEAYSWPEIRMGQISELIFPREQAATLIPIALAFIADAFARQRVDAIVCDGFPSDIREQLSRCGYLDLVPGRTEHVAYFDRDGSLPEDLMGSADNWLITAGDGDRSTSHPRIDWII